MATIQKRGDTYKITASCGYDMKGKQIRKHVTWEPAPGMTERQIAKELDRQKMVFEEKCRTGQVLDSSIRFSDFADKWFSDYAEKQLRPKTLAHYRALMKRIRPAIGNIQLCKLQPQHLLAFYDNLEDTGIREDMNYKCTLDFNALLRERALTKEKLAELAGVSCTVLRSINQGKNISQKSMERVCKALGLQEKASFDPVAPDACLSSKTVLHHHRLISTILNTAVQWQVIFSNPCDRVKPPKVEHKEPRFLDEHQAAKLLTLIERESMQFRTIIKLLLYTGFRRGELCGLEWTDIDFEHRVIHVRRASLYLPEKGVYEDETKNYSSMRSIKAPGIAIDMLREYRAWQAQERLGQGDQWVNSNRLFTAWNGKPINPGTITSWFHDFILKTDLPYINIHSLRHTNATLQIAGGVPLSTVADRLGHADTNTTGRIYVHAIRSADEAAADTLENILTPTKNNKNKSG